MLTLTTLENRDTPNVNGSIADGVLRIGIESSHVVTVGVYRDHVNPYLEGLISVTRDDVDEALVLGVLPRAGVNVHRIEISTERSGRGTQSLIVLDDSLQGIPVDVVSGQWSQDRVVINSGGAVNVTAQKNDIVQVLGDDGDTFTVEQQKKKAATLDRGDGQEVTIRGGVRSVDLGIDRGTSGHWGIAVPVVEVVETVPLRKGARV